MTNPVIKKIKSKKELTSFLKKSKTKQVHDIYKQLQFELFINTQPKHYFGDNSKQKKVFEDFYQNLISNSKE